MRLAQRGVTFSELKCILGILSFPVSLSYYYHSFFSHTLSLRLLNLMGLIEYYVVDSTIVEIDRQLEFE